MSYLSKYFIVFILCLFLSNSFAQQYNFKNYTPKDGLAGSTVYNIFQDSKGYLWFATQGGGISRFNGKAFKNFTKNDGLVANDITCISEDSLGNIWFGTGTDGVSKFDGLKFVNYTVDNGLVNNSVYAIYCDEKNSVWIGTEEGGVSIYSNGRFKKLTTDNGLSSNMVYAITQDNKGDYWFAMKNGLSKYDGTIITNYTKIKSFEHKRFWSLLNDRKGNIWAGSSDGGVVLYNGKDFEEVKIPQEVRTDFIGSITEDKLGNIWFATQEHGALKFDGNRFFIFNENNGLSSNAVLSISTDYEGNIWMGTQLGGVNFLSSEAFANYTEKDELVSNKITTLFQDKDDALIIGTINDGVTVFSGNKFSHIKSVNELSHANISFIYNDSRDNLWVGTNEGAYILKKKNGTYVLSKRIKELNNVALQMVISIVEDKQGSLWIATYGTGLFEINKAGQVTQYVQSNGIVIDNILTMFKDSKGIIWLGTNDAGLIKYENEKFKNYTEQDGLASKSVWTIAEDNNHNLYLGTNDAGISSFDGEKFKTIDVHKGLYSNNITSLLWDNFDTTLFVGTDKGINKLKLTADGSLKSLRSYGEQEGFKGGEVIPNAAIIDNKGIIWIGTPNGLFKYDRKFDFPNVTPPKLNLNDIRLSYQSVDWKKFSDSVDLRTNIPYDLILSHRNNHLTFDFQALTTSDVKYTYILEGQDNEWSPLSSTPVANFTNIAAGKTYTFRAKAVNSYGVWSKDEITFKFTINPPWWQTWWFYTLLGVFTIASIFGFINYRTAQLAKEKKELEEKVIERTQELKTSNTKLSEAIGAITDSMNYAQRIQRSFLTSEEILNKTLNDYFILYKPRDIVSGDFYWSFDLPDRTLIACADSTGHGIPGAFMSLIGISLLNEISHSKSMYEPAAMLDELRRIIITALNPERLDSGGKDGMDIALISIFKSPNSDEVKINFAGANNGLHILTKRNNEIELLEFKGDKQPVGFYSSMKPFVQQEIVAKKGDILYMFTDGYADQFGGPKGKKFMAKKLKQNLIAISAQPLSEQKQSLDNALIAWQNDLEQVDDVTVIGIKIG